MTDRLKLSEIGKDWSINFDQIISERLDLYKLTTFSPNKSLPIHNWYPYLQGYSAKLIEILIAEYNITNKHIVLDPWCGVGTTNLVCRQHGIDSIGTDISPLSVFISKIKTSPLPDREIVIHELEKIKKLFTSNKKLGGKPTFDILEKSFTTEMYIDLMHLKSILDSLIIDDLVKNFLKLAFLTNIEKVSLFQKDGSHYRFKETSKSLNILESFSETIINMLDGDPLKQAIQEGNANIHRSDSRKLNTISDESIDFVITSPPYLNRNNYIAQNKIELMLGDFINSFQEYRQLTYSTLRSHVEAKTNDYSYDLKIKQLSLYMEKLIERKNDLSNLNTLDMVHGYFIDMHYSLNEIARVLKKNGQAFLVVGNSAWAGVSIEVDKVLAEIALLNGLKTNNIFVTRYKLNSAQQIKKYGKIPIRESIIVLEKK